VLPLLLTFLLTTLGAFALLWAVTAYVQQTLYESSVDRLPMRSLIGAVLLGCFYTFWVYANTRADSKDKYGVAYDFSPTARHEIDEFVAVRRFPTVKESDGTAREERVSFKRTALGRTARFTDDRNRVFRPNDSLSLTVALEVKHGPDGPTRYDAVIDAKGNYELPNGRSPRFVEAGGKRFVEADTPGLVFAPSTSALLGALALNLGGFVVWLVVFWPCLRFTLGHAVGGAFGFGLVMMLFVVPLLFEKNQLTPRFAAASPLTPPPLAP
jgi:hypothetical protein